MQRPFSKLAIIGVLLLSSTLISGCGALRFTYGQAPDLVYWWLDGYADFDEMQAERVRTEVRGFFDWHRATQLPDYARLLIRAREQVLAPEPITPEQVCRWYDDIVSHVSPIVERSLPAAATAVMSLTPGQLQHVQRKYDKVNANFRDDFLQPNPKARLKAAVDRVVDRTESLYGRLDAAQKERIARLVAASPFDPQAWLAERQSRQRETLTTVRALQAERASPEQVQAALRVLVTHVQRSPHEAYRQYGERLRVYNCMVGAQVHNAMNREQRLTAADRLKGWADDLRAMSGRR